MLRHAITGAWIFFEMVFRVVCMYTNALEALEFVYYTDICHQNTLLHMNSYILKYVSLYLLYISDVT